MLRSYASTILTTLIPGIDHTQNCGTLSLVKLTLVYTVNVESAHDIASAGANWHSETVGASASLQTTPIRPVVFRNVSGAPPAMRDSHRTEDLMLTLLEARWIIEDAIVKARQLDCNISVAVCDVDGRLIALNRMDGAFCDADRGSIGKAIAAAVIGRPSDELAERLMASGRHRVALGKVLTPLGRRGGLPIVQGGVVEGACGVSGAHTNEQDKECAHAGIAALDVANCVLSEPISSLSLSTDIIKARASPRHH